MLPFVMLPRPLQESNVVGKGGTAGFLGKAYDPYTSTPRAMTSTWPRWTASSTDDLKLPQEVFAMRLERRAQLRDLHQRRHARHREGGERLQPRRILPARAQPHRLRPRPRRLRSRRRRRKTPRPLRPQHLRPKLPPRPPPRRSRHPRRRSHLAQGRQLRQPLLGPPRRPLPPA
jgi:hypothetical protein